MVSQASYKPLVLAAETMDHGLGVSCCVILSKGKPSMKEDELRNLSEEIGHLRHIIFYTL